VTAIVLAAVAACALSSGGHEIRGADGAYLGRAECRGQSVVVRDARDGLQFTIEPRGRGVRVTDAAGRLVLEIR
jgi:hypothetical protein